MHLDVGAGITIRSTPIVPTFLRRAMITGHFVPHRRSAQNDASPLWVARQLGHDTRPSMP
jgi:hypothetical protein